MQSDLASPAVTCIPLAFHLLKNLTWQQPLHRKRKTQVIRSDKEAVNTFFHSVSTHIILSWFRNVTSQFSAPPRLSQTVHSFWQSCALFKLARGWCMVRNMIPTSYCPLCPRGLGGYFWNYSHCLTQLFLRFHVTMGLAFQGQRWCSAIQWLISLLSAHRTCFGRFVGLQSN